MNEQTQPTMHPVAAQLTNWFREAITVEEINARVGIVQNAMDSFIAEVNKQIEAQQAAAASATDEKGEAVELEEVSE